MIFIVTRTATQGLRAGLASALGVEAGTLPHVAAAALGVAALIATSPIVFGIVKYAGVAYLTYLGIQHFAARHPPRPSLHGGPHCGDCSWTAPAVHPSIERPG